MTADGRRRIVVCGGGPAAASAAAALRDLGFDGELTLLSAESNPPYSRPPLSKAFLTGVASRDEIDLFHGDAELRLEAAVTRVDPAARRVHTADGDVVPYDGLVIATGTAARRPADENVCVLATIEDAESLRPRLVSAGTAIVVGSGLLAFELASAAAASGAATTLVTRRGSIQARIGELGAFLLRRAREHGVTVLETVDGGRFHEGGVEVVEHGRLEADLVLAALGATVNTGILPDHALDGRGIVVDDWCRVAPGIVAAGDIAVTRREDGSLHRDATWTNALAQARSAARALLDEDAPPFHAVPYGWTEAFGVEVKFAGTVPQGVEYEIVDGDLAEGRALLRWPGAAGAVGYRVPIGRLRGLVSAGAPA